MRYARESPSVKCLNEGKHTKLPILREGRCFPDLRMTVPVTKSTPCLRARPADRVPRIPGIQGLNRVAPAYGGPGVWTKSTAIAVSVCWRSSAAWIRLTASGPAECGRSCCHSGRSQALAPARRSLTFSKKESASF